VYMPAVRSFTVLPTLPDSLKDLECIAKNMFWSWNPEFWELFKRVDANLWANCAHNPVKLLANVSQARLEELTKNRSFLSELRQAVDKLNSYQEGSTWFEKVCSVAAKPTIAYFSAEYGIHECLPIYAGGLGILAGDHLKSCSDLGVPLVGVGLLYQRGYFRQYLNSDGWQQEAYVENNFNNMPVELLRDETGQPLTVCVEYPGRCVWAQIWRACIGRVNLHLLDTNISCNSPADRMITASLYGGDVELRIRQEIMLGIGGLRALAATGLAPTVCHMNEGHAAFMALERIRQLQKTMNLTFQEALEATRPSNVFTMHTLVKAGLDEFPVELMDKYFADYLGPLGISKKQLLALGRILPDDETEPFKMPVLAMKLSGHINGVSRLHGRLSRQMWGSLWPGVPVKEVPIASITNGVHIRSWLSEDISTLYERYLDPNWTDGTLSNSVWEGVDEIPDEQLWRAHQRCKEQLIVFARNRLKGQMKRRGTYHSELNWAEEVLDPEALTIGFGRRFVAYKRANLLLKDPQRLETLLNNPHRPVQIIFAGKAHPKDTEGKDIIRQIIHFATQHNVRRRVVFIEDYDMDVARYMTRGVDVWLNNPRRPMEASGTSGMKASLNGVLNVSTLDGWWCEGYTPQAGWVIGAEENYRDRDYQDQVDSRALYSLMENEVIPLFYSRASDNLPRAWIRRMKNSIERVAPRFNTHRMVAEYTRRYYNPAAARWGHLTADSMAKAKSLAGWRSNIEKAWPKLAIRDVNIEVNNGQGYRQLDPKRPELQVGTVMNVKALVELAGVNPGDVSVELYHGPVDAGNKIREGSALKMEHAGKAGENGEHWFAGSLRCQAAGQHGVTVRILPCHSDVINPCQLGLILWEAASAKQNA
jgi:starch phosphorylase